MFIITAKYQTVLNELTAGLKEICIDESESSTSISKDICNGTSDNMLEATVSPANIYLQVVMLHNVHN